MVIGIMILLLNYVILKTLWSLLLSWNCSIKAKQIHSPIYLIPRSNVTFSQGLFFFCVGTSLSP